VASKYLSIIAKGEDETSLLIRFIDSEVMKEFLLKYTSIRCVLHEGLNYCVISKRSLTIVQQLEDLGPETLKRSLSELCIKAPLTNSERFFKIAEREFSVPSNIESGSDTLAYKQVILLMRLGFKMKVAEMQSLIPSVSEGWTRSYSLLIDTLSNVAFNALEDSKDAKAMLPHHTRNEVVKTISYMIAYRWANRRRISRFLTEQIKQKGNVSEERFSKFIETWGTQLNGNICGDLISSVYQIIGIIANIPGLDNMIPRGYFLSGQDIRKLCAPSRQITEKKGKDVKVVSAGTLNTLRFDNVRFLLPSERLKAKRLNESSELDNKIREFDSKEVCNRNFAEFEETVKKYFEDNSKNYYTLRRNARSRLYAIKEVRREAKQSDVINDTEFTSENFISTVVRQAESMMIDVGRKVSVKERLEDNIFKSLPENLLRISGKNTDQ
jgi:hypothetical protein